MLMREPSGSALLLVVGATAVIGALALAMLSASLLSYEVALAEQHGAMARLLAASARDLFAADLGGGGVTLPAAGGTLVWQPPLPPPPAGFGDLPGGCRVAVTVRPVMVQGDSREWEVFGAGSALFDADAEAWCGRGYARLPARFASIGEGIAVRLF